MMHTKNEDDVALSIGYLSLSSEPQKAHVSWPSDVIEDKHEASGCRGPVTLNTRLQFVQQLYSAGRFLTVSSEFP
jgi:hypothetical protein